jgi:23S rRNA (cytidine1920-2'-O)/16S rRNA (cytidine1409-2'-O)-methyltransferase
MAKSYKQALVDLLVARGLFSDAEMARRAIWAGEVIVGDEMVDQPATRIPVDAEIRLRNQPGRFASRAGEKLEGALRELEVTVTDRVILDVGASTGGFTDCLLVYGAQRVYAVDIGRGQLAQRLHLDPRVADMGGHDIFAVTADMLVPAPDLAVADVTFRSLAEVLPHVRSLLAGAGEMVVLLKPLFEARLLGLGKLENIQQRVFEVLLPRLAEAALPVHNVVCSTVPGSGGAIEFFLHIKPPALEAEQLIPKIEAALSAGKLLLEKGQRKHRSGQKRQQRWRRFTS